MKDERRKERKRKEEEKEKEKERKGKGRMKRKRKRKEVTPERSFSSDTARCLLTQEIPWITFNLNLN